MMEYSKFEQQIANTLREDEVNLDINALIEGIHGKKKKDKKWFFILFFSLGIIGTLAGIMYFTFGQDESGSEFKINDKTSLNHYSEISILSSKDDKQNATPPSIISKPISETKAVTAQDTKQNISKKITSNIYNKITTHSSENKENTTISHTLASSNNESEIELNIESQNNKNIIIAPLAVEPNSIVYDHLQVMTDKVVCPTFSNRHKWYLELIPEIGYFRPLKKFENTSGEQNNIFDLRKDKEKTLEGIQVALYIQLRKQKSPLYIRTGLSYAKLTEKMQLDYSYTKLDTTRGIISVTVSQTGDTVTTIIGDIITESKLSGKKVAHHSFSLYDIPLAIGYEKKMDQWSLGIEAGIMLNLSMSSNGSTLASDTSFLAVDLPINQFRTNVGLSYFGGLTLGRNFNRFGRFYLAARARIIHTSFSTDQNRFKQSYHFAGLHLGYVYTF